MTTFFIFSAKYLVSISILIGMAYFLRQPRPIKTNMLKLSLISLPIMYIVAKIAGHFFYNARPFVVGNFTPLIAHAADNGFPSDHTLLAAGIAMIVSLFNKRVGTILWILTIIIAIARVYTGVHHVIDVIGSMVIAVAVTVLVGWWMEGKRKV